MVVDNVRVRDSNSGPSWAPIIAIADQHGYRVEFTPSMRGTGMGLPTGREGTVVYLPHDPQTARVFTRRHMPGPVLFVLAVALGLPGHRRDGLTARRINPRPRRLPRLSCSTAFRSRTS